MKMHKSNFPLAFAAVSRYVTGNLKTTAREILKELLAEIRKCADARAMREVITFVNANNDDLKLLGTDDELKDNDLFEELMDVLKRVPSLNNVHHLARMPETQIGEWESLTIYLVDIIAHDTTPTRTPRSTALSAYDGGRGGRSGRGGRGGRDGRGGRGGRGRGNGRGGGSKDVICWRCGGKHYSTANVRYGTAACTVQCHCMKCGKDDHSTEHHDIDSDVQERRAACGAKAMAVASTQSDAPGHLFCLMVRVATTTSPSHVASESQTFLLGEDDDPQIVMLVEDEHGTEFKLLGTMPDTLGHSDTIGKIKAAIGDRDRIDDDAAGAFLHTPLLAAGAFAYLPPPPSAEGLACLEQLQPVVDLRAHSARTSQAKSIQS